MADFIENVIMSLALAVVFAVVAAMLLAPFALAIWLFMLFVQWAAGSC